MGNGAWPFLVGGVVCLLNCNNKRDLNLLNSPDYFGSTPAGSSSSLFNSQPPYMNLTNCCFGRSSQMVTLGPREPNPFYFVQFDLSGRRKGNKEMNQNFQQRISYFKVYVRYTGENITIVDDQQSAYLVDVRPIIEELLWSRHRRYRMASYRQSNAFPDPQ